MERVTGIDTRGNKYFTYFWFDTSAEKCKYYIAAFAPVPEDLRAANGSMLYLQYNITKGPRVGTFSDSSWL